MTQVIESLDALMGRILDLDARKVDIVADTRRMHMESGSTPEFAGCITVDTPTGLETFGFNDHARGQIAESMGVPRRYYERMYMEAPGLLADNCNHWFRETPKRRMLRGYRDGALPVVGRAWLSDRYKRRDHIELARHLLPEFERLGYEVEFHHAAVTERRLYIRALFPRLTRDVKLNDPVRWGVDIRNSEVGSGLLAISGFVLRLACTNGMTTTEVLSSRHVGQRILEEGILSEEAERADDKAYWLAARDILRATITEARFEEVVDQLKGTLTGEKIERPIAATEILQNRFGLSDEEREAVLTRLVAGADFSRWGALNAMTATAQVVPTFERRVELEEAGWAVAQMPEREWAAVAVAN